MYLLHTGVAIMGAIVDTHYYLPFYISHVGLLKVGRPVLGRISTLLLPYSC